MITKATVKKYHAKEIMHKPAWMKGTYHCVILVSKELGLSVKPYFIDEDEKIAFIKDRAEVRRISKMRCRKEIDAPDYCLHHMAPTGKAAAIQPLLKNGEFKNGGNNPSCPFY